MQQSPPESAQKSPFFFKEWRKARKITQQQCADAIGRDKSVWSKIESGKSRVQVAYVSAIEELFGASIQAMREPPPEGTRPLEPGEVGQVGNVRIIPSPAEAIERISESAANNTPISESDLQAIRKMMEDHKDLPIFEAMEEGPADFHFQHNAIEWTHRPDILKRVPAGFAVYVVCEDMEPAYNRGDLIYCHPGKPVTVGDDVLVVNTVPVDTHFTATIGTISQTEGDTITIAKHKSGETRELIRPTVYGVYKIIGKMNKV